MRNKIYRTAVSMIVVGGVIASACGSDDESSEEAAPVESASDNSVVDDEAGLTGTLTVWDFAEFEAGYEAVFDDMMETAGGDATIEFLPIGDYYVEYGTVLEEGRADILFTYMQVENYGEAADAGLLREMSSVWDEEGFTGTMGGEDLARRDEGVYALPHRQGIFPMLYVNNDLIAAAGAEPANGTHYLDLDDWLAAADKVVAAGSPGIALQGTPDVWGADHIVLQAFVNNMELGDLEALTNFDALPEETMLASLEAYDELTDSSSLLLDGWQSRDFATTEGLFAQGQAAFLSSGSWSYASIAEQAPDLNFSVMPFPDLGPEPGQNGTIGDGIVIAENTDVPELAEAFYRAMGSVEGSLLRSEIGEIPTRIDIDADLLEARSAPAVVSVLEAAELGGGVVNGIEAYAGLLLEFSREYGAGPLITGEPASEAMVKEIFDAYRLAVDE